jgi:hypothetical protein
MIDDIYLQSRYEADVRYLEPMELPLSEQERALATRAS